MAKEPRTGALSALGPISCTYTEVKEHSEAGRTGAGLQSQHSREGLGGR